MKTTGTSDSGNWKFKTWGMVAIGGAIGWWVFLSHCGLLPLLGTWTELLARCAAVGCLVMSCAPMGRDMDTIIEKWINRHGYKPAHTLRIEKKHAGKWILAPIWIWWLPAIFMFADMISARLVF